MIAHTRPEATARSTGRASAQAQLALLRDDFDDHAGRALALPVAGTIVWSAIGVAALILPSRTANVVLLLGTGVIFPIGLAVAHQLGERLIDNPSPLAALMGRCVLMVNLLWAVHLTMFALAPTYLPLTIGIGLGLHWIVFGWIIGHPVGLIHAVARTGLVTAAWWLFPADRVSAVSAAVVLTYGYTLHALATRPRTAGHERDVAALEAGPDRATMRYATNGVGSPTKYRKQAVVRTRSAAVGDGEVGGVLEPVELADEFRT